MALLPLMKAISRSWLIVFLLAASGCESPEKLPLTGRVSLQLVRVSPSGIYFRLLNQSKEAVSFRGVVDKSLGANPWGTLMECKSPGSDAWQEGPYALIDGTPQIVAVRSGEQVDLVIHDNLVEQYKGGRCRLSLRFESGTFIESDEFNP
jgi:hypothetical protein